MRNPLARLEAFEDKYGDYKTLVDNYVKAVSEYERRSTPGWSVGVTQKYAREADRTLRLLRAHSDLIYQWMGYMQGYEDALKESAPK